MPFSKVTYPCFFCSKEFLFGPDEYEGQFIAQWDLFLCDTCVADSTDGVSARYQDRLQHHLDALGVKSTISENGLIVVP